MPDSTAARSSRRLAGLLGVTAQARRDIVSGLFGRSPDEISGYWLQLALAVGIATLGLVMGSGAVIIGAMLVAPLMGPIVELALSLLVGAGSVMLGAAARIVLSIVAAITGAALITTLLPFTDPTAEILARVSPTMLDLFVAMCCAVAAAWVTVRPASGASSTAAGTAIGISLVPPLCTVGFGIGNRDAAIAEGALLLFVANFTAILACATLFFWLVGINPLPASAFEGRAPTHYGFGRLLTALGRRIDRGLASRFHLLWRLAVPFALVLAVSVPLERAYRRMAWQVRTRSAVARIVRETPRLAEAVSTAALVERDRVSFRAVIVGTAGDAETLTDTVRERIRAESGVSPAVAITAVPSAAAAALDPPSIVADTLPILPRAPTPDEALRETEAALRDRIQALWPARAGTLVAQELTVAAERVGLRLIAIGSGLEPTAIGMLERDLSARLARPVRLTMVSVPADALSMPSGRGQVWVEAVRPRVEAARETPALRMCVEVPERRAREAAVHERVEEWVRTLGATRVQVASGPTWSLQIRDQPCPGTTTP